MEAKDSELSYTFHNNNMYKYVLLFVHVWFSKFKEVEKEKEKRLRLPYTSKSNSMFILIKLLLFATAALIKHI